MTKFEYRFCPMNGNKIANGRPLSACTCGHSNLVIDHPISSKLHIWITFIKFFPKIDCGYCLKNDNQDGCTNGHRLSVCMCGHSNLVIYHPIYSIFYIWTTFIKILFISEYGLCQMNDNQACHQTDIPFHCRILCWALCWSRPTVLV